MGLINLLIGLPAFGDLGSVAVKHEWIVNIIKWIIGFVGDVGLGIIVFTAILKLITLPLDIYSRASMKKNNLKMEEMKPDLEKLQKQYKNNQQLYQQKMMALYKKNGYSAFSACLPTIITVIFFIIVISAFNSYSRLTDKEVFNKMGQAYDASLSGFVTDDILVEDAEKNMFYLNIDKALENEKFTSYFNYNSTGDRTDEESYKLIFSEFISNSALLDKYESLSAYVKNGALNAENVELTNKINLECQNYIVLKLNENQIQTLVSSGIINYENGKYSIRDRKGLALGQYNLDEYFVGETYEVNFGKILSESNEINDMFITEGKNYVGKVALNLICNDYIDKNIKMVAREASAKAYEENASKSSLFPWVKNLWVVDSPFKTAIPSIKELESSIGAENMGSLKDENVYAELTYNLGSYKTSGFGKGNGYFILVAISILSMLGSTVINNKANKTQMQLSTVDGENSQAANTQKIMTWMMPIMFGVFAFIYSSAFSIYMITSTILSTVSTLLINYFVEKAFKNKIIQTYKEQENKKQYGKRRDI